MTVSIITVAYNSELTIRETLTSVEQQDYEDLEHIIVDGASTDSTITIIKEFKNIHKFISEKDKGIYDAMNKGIELADGDIIGILNSDDVFYDNFTVSKVVSQFKSSNCDAVYGDLIYFYTNQPLKIVRFWKSRDYYKSFFDDGYVIPHPTLFVKREVYEKVGLYNPNFKISSDYEFMLKSFKLKQFVPVYLPLIIVKMRMGGESTKSFKNILIGNKEILISWKKNKLKIPIGFFFKRFLFKIKQII